MLEQLKDSTMAWALLSLIAFVSLVIGLVAFFDARQERELFWSRNSRQIVTIPDLASLERLKLLYDGIAIKDISITRIALWYSGRVSISPADFLSEQPLAIIGNNDVTIFDCKIIYQNDINGRFRIKENETGRLETKKYIQFESIKKKEGIVIEIIHSGCCEDLKIVGDFKEGPVTYLPEYSIISNINGRTSSSMEAIIKEMDRKKASVLVKRSFPAIAYLAGLVFLTSIMMWRFLSETLDAARDSGDVKYTWIIDVAVLVASVYCMCKIIYVIYNVNRSNIPLKIADYYFD